MTALNTGEKFTFFSVDRNFTLNSLMPHSTYVFVIAAATDVGTGPTSHLVSLLTHEEGKMHNICTRVCVCMRTCI